MLKDLKGGKLTVGNEFQEWLPKVSDAYTKKMPLDVVIQKYLLGPQFSYQRVGRDRSQISKVNKEGVRVEVEVVYVHHSLKKKCRSKMKKRQ